MPSGYLYAFANDSMPEIFKVGCTTRNPFERAKELRTTGVPTPFRVVAAISVSNIRAAESRIHSILSSEGARVQADREFFKTDLITILRAFSELENLSVPTDHTIESAEDHFSAFESAKKFSSEIKSTRENIKKVINMYERAIELGSSNAARALQLMYYNGTGVERNTEKADFYYNLGESMQMSKILETLEIVRWFDHNIDIVHVPIGGISAAFIVAVDECDLDAIQKIVPEIHKFVDAKDLFSPACDYDAYVFCGAHIRLNEMQLEIESQYGLNDPKIIHIEETRELLMSLEKNTIDLDFLLAFVVSRMYLTSTFFVKGMLEMMKEALKMYQRISPEKLDIYTFNKIILSTSDEMQEIREKFYEYDFYSMSFHDLRHGMLDILDEILS